MEKSKYVELAYRTIEKKIHEGKRLHFQEFEEEIEDTPWCKEVKALKAGVFVSLEIKGELRGCIGTVEATKEHVGEEIISNALQAAFHDPRFFPLEKHELSEIVTKVDVLMQKEEIESMEKLDAKKYGVVVEKGIRRGLLLPDLEGVETPIQQVQIALSKAGIKRDEKFTLYRFEVLRYY